MYGSEHWRLPRCCRAAFDTNGAPAWHGTAPETLPVYDSWQFRTAVPAGSFADLAAQLHPSDAKTTGLAQKTTTGEARLSYPRLRLTPPLTVFGALVARTPDGTVIETALPRQVAEDLAQLRNTPAHRRARPTGGDPAKLRRRLAGPTATRPRSVGMEGMEKGAGPGPGPLSGPHSCFDHLSRGAIDACGQNKASDREGR